MELNFSCQQCSWCCRFEGGVVRLSREDLNNLCTWSGLTQNQFIQVYCRFLEDNEGNSWLCLKTLQNGDCLFWNKDLCEGKGGCECYTARPVQCSTFPFWTNLLSDKEKWEAESKNCRGINCGKLHSEEEIQSQLKMYQARIPLKKEDVL